MWPLSSLGNGQVEQNKLMIHPKVMSEAVSPVFLKIHQGFVSFQPSGAQPPLPR